MNWVVSFAKSSIGAKIIMGVTGAALVGFILAHMLGNLQVFLGPDALNQYAKNLKDLGGLLWLARGGLIAVAILHIASGIRLAKLNRDARPVAYAHKATVKASFASRYMGLSGLVVLAFLVYHLLHFTLGVTHPDQHSMVDNMQRHDVYSMVILGFRDPAVALSYIIAICLLGLHLNHGASSLFQSLGLKHSKYNDFIAKIGPLVAIIVVVGNISMPIAVLCRWVGAEIGG